MQKIACTIIPDYSTGKSSEEPQDNVKVVRVLYLLLCLCYHLQLSPIDYLYTIYLSNILVVSVFKLPIILKKMNFSDSVLSPFSKTKPALMPVCEGAVGAPAHVSANVHLNPHLSLLPGAQAFRVRKQAKLWLLSVSRESGFC